MRDGRDIESVQSEHGIQRCFAAYRPLANILNLPGFEFESAQEILELTHLRSAGEGTTHVPSSRLSNAAMTASSKAASVTGEPCVAAIYQLDSIVRRSTSLQLTADGRAAGTLQSEAGVVA